MVAIHGGSIRAELGIRAHPTALGRSRAARSTGAVPTLGIGELSGAGAGMRLD